MMGCNRHTGSPPVGAAENRDAFGHKQAFGVHNGRADG